MTATTPNPETARLATPPRPGLEERALAVQGEVLAYALADLDDPRERAARRREIRAVPPHGALWWYGYGLVVGWEDADREREGGTRALGLVLWTILMLVCGYAAGALTMLLVGA